MASTKAPLFGLDASGSIGKTIVFAKWKGRTYARMHVTPANPQSEGQFSVRAYTQFCGANYATYLTAGNRTQWEADAAADQITGLNAWVRDSMQQRVLDKGVRDQSDTAEGAATAAPVLTATGGAGLITLTWTNGAGSVWSTPIHLTLAATIVSANTNLRRIVLPTVLAYNITGLVAGTYSVALKHGEIGGVLSADDEVEGIVVT